MNWKTAIFILLLALLASVLFANSEGRGRDAEGRSSGPKAATREDRAPISGRVAWSNWRDVTESGFPVSTTVETYEIFPERVPPRRARLEADLAGLDVVFEVRRGRREPGDER